MKKLLTAILCLVSFSGFAQPHDFTIEGRIEGLEKGDKLNFIKIILPDWERENAFEVTVSEPGQFRYDGTHEHTQLYIMTYTPADPERVIASDRMGLEVVVRDGTTTLSGDWEYIYYSPLKGGLYSDPEYQRIDSAQKSLSKERGYCLKMASLARKEGDTKTAQEWSDKGNAAFSNPLFMQYQNEMKAYRERTFDSELLTFQAAQGAMNEPEQVKPYYARLTPEVRESYYGRLTGEFLKQMETVEVGKPAPAFTLKTNTGEQITLETTKGNYLLIYHWGMCPGSMQMDNQIQEFYAKYRDKGVQVVGISEMRDAVQNYFESLPEDDTTERYGIPLRKTLQGMLSHPFPDVELDKDPQSKEILTSHVIRGLPFVILISPESTILARGYWDSFNEAKTILEQAFPES